MGRWRRKVGWNIPGTCALLAGVIKAGLSVEEFFVHLQGGWGCWKTCGSSNHKLGSPIFFFKRQQSAFPLINEHRGNGRK